MVAGEILSKALVRSGGSWTYPGSHSGRMTLRRFEQGRLAKPDFFEGFTDSSHSDRRAVYLLFLALGFVKRLKPPEDPDGMFSVVSAGSAEFIQDWRFFHDVWRFCTVHELPPDTLVWTVDSIVPPFGSRCSVTSIYESTISF